MLEIVAHVERELARGATTLELDIVDPDLGAGHHAGEQLTLGEARVVHRPWRAWCDLAERLGLRLGTPRPSAASPHVLRVRLTRLDRAPASRASGDDPTERYGTRSAFARIRKLEDPRFVIDLTEAVERCGLPARARVLDLGANTGDALALLLERIPALRDATLVGVDHSASAIAAARERFAAASARVELHVADIAELGALGLGTFDLVVSIGTLQSPTIDDRALLRKLVQHHLGPGGALIIGVPNCRYVDGELEYGARMKNFRQPELGLVVKDVAFYRTYLQQHHRQVFVTGKHYVLVTGVPRARVPPRDAPE